MRAPEQTWRARLARWLRRTPVPASARPMRLRFAGAQLSRLTSDWTTTPSSANRANDGTLEILRARVAALRRDNPLVARYAALSVENILGADGITLQAQVPSARGTNAALSKQCETLWYRWSERAGIDGASWLHCCMQLVESWRLMGECLAEIKIDRRLPMGIAVEVLDVDLIDDRYSTPREEGRGWITQGVEYDALGRPVALHLLTRHRTDPGPHYRRRVPRDQVLYHAHRPRPMQARGITPLAPVMLRLQMLNGTQEALVALNRAAASKMGFLLTKGEYVSNPDDPAAPVELEAAPLEIEQLPEGMEFQAWDPGQPTATYEPLFRILAQEIAGALGVSYAALTGDLSQTSYASGRMGTIAERDAWRVLQQEFIQSVCVPMYLAFIQVQLVRGALVAPAGMEAWEVATARWHGRRWDWVDPAKDIAAVKDALDLGLTTLTRELNARGLDLREILEEAQAERALAKALGVPLSFGAQNAPRAVAPTAEDASDATPPRLVIA